MLTQLKYGFAILPNAVPDSYYSIMAPVQNYFLQTMSDKSKYSFPEKEELGYRNLIHKEMFFIRNKQLPTQLSICTKLIEDLHALGIDCLQLISNELQLHPNKLLSIIDDVAFPDAHDSSSILRLIHYQSVSGNEYACDSHQDLGLLTFICPTQIPALEIYDYVEDKSWVDIELAQGPEDMIIMAGEALSFISNKYYLPATHRVRTPQEPRLSIFYQLRFRNDAIIDSQDFETPITGKFLKPFRITGAEYLKKEIKVRHSVNGSY